MSRSSTRSDRCERSLARGQTEPLAALVAVLALVAGVALYSGAYTAALPATDDRDLAEPTLRRVTERVATGPVVDPARLNATAGAGPSGHRLHVTLRTTQRNWSVGPEPPRDADRAARPVSVRRPDGTALPGRLVVEVWT